MAYDALPEAEFRHVLSYFGDGSFSTRDFIERLKSELENRWAMLEEKYGPGGAGAGRYRTAYHYISMTLNHHANAGVLEKLGYRPAHPEWNWGSPVIRYWTIDRTGLGGTLYPGELQNPLSYIEGAKKQVVVNRYERDSTVRQKCIEHHGPKCAACSFDFEHRYGPHGAGFIHVHHITPLSELGETYEIDPINDLIPVCPNCHAMIHYKGKVLSVDQVRAMLRRADGDSRQKTSE